MCVWCVDRCNVTGETGEKYDVTGEWPHSPLQWLAVLTLLTLLLFDDVIHYLVHCLPLTPSPSRVKATYKHRSVACIYDN